MEDIIKYATSVKGKARRLSDDLALRFLGKPVDFFQAQAIEEFKLKRVKALQGVSSDFDYYLSQLEEINSDLNALELTQKSLEEKKASYSIEGFILGIRELIAEIIGLLQQGFPKEFPSQPKAEDALNAGIKPGKLGEIFNFLDINKFISSESDRQAFINFFGGSAIGCPERSIVWIDLAQTSKTINQASLYHLLSIMSNDQVSVPGVLDLVVKVFCAGNERKPLKYDNLKSAFSKARTRNNPTNEATTERRKGRIGKLKENLKAIKEGLPAEGKR